MFGRLIAARRSILGTLLLCAAPLAAQDSVPARAKRTAPVREVLVLDAGRQPIPYAVVAIGNSQPRVADAFGVAELPSPVDADSAQLLVRRIGYSPFGDWAKLDAEGVRFEVRMQPLARALNPVTVQARRDTPLARTGFYDRLERVARSATVARFITPEELDLRVNSQFSGVLAAEPYIRIERTSGRAILTGRQPGCGMTLVLDGMRMTGMVEELASHEGQAEVRRMGGGAQAVQRYLQGRQTIDEVISTFSVAAVEIYPSAQGAPPEIQRVAGASACGIIVVWTGGR